MFRPILFSRKPVNSVSLNVNSFMTLQCHRMQLKCLQTNFTLVLRIKPIVFNVKRHVNITTVLKMSKNYYDILGIPRNASQKQIKDAYFKLAMKHHPDKNQGVLTQKFRDIKEAYDVLSNDSGRMKYNNSKSLLKYFYKDFNPSTINITNNFFYDSYNLVFITFKFLILFS